MVFFEDWRFFQLLVFQFFNRLANKLLREREHGKRRIHDDLWSLNEAYRLLFWNSWFLQFKGYDGLFFTILVFLITITDLWFCFEEFEDWRPFQLLGCFNSSIDWQTNCLERVDMASDVDTTSFDLRNFSKIAVKKFLIPVIRRLW